MNRAAAQSTIDDVHSREAASAGRRLLSGMGWTLLGMAAARGAALVASFFVARSLGAVSFGQLGIVENSIGMLAVFANLGLSLTSTKFIAKYAQADPVRAGRVLGLCLAFSFGVALLASVVVLAAGPCAARVALASPQLSGPLRLGTAVLMLSSVNGALNGALVGLQAFKLLARLNLVLGMVTVPALAFGAASGGVMGAIGGLIAVQALTALLHAVALHRAAASHRIAISLRGSWQERRVLAAFSIPALVNSALRGPVHWLCIVMLVHQPGGFTEMGLLHASNPWFLLLMFLPGQLANVYYPMFESALARNDANEVQRLVWKSVQLNAITCGGMALVLAVGAESVAAWYGTEYLASAAALRISALTGLVIAIQQPLSAYLVAVVNMWLVTACSLLWAVACVVSSYALLNYGASGVAAGRLVGYIAYAALIAGIALPRLMSARQPERQATTSADLHRYRSAA